MTGVGGLNPWENPGAYAGPTNEHSPLGDRGVGGGTGKRRVTSHDLLSGTERGRGGVRRMGQANITLKKKKNRKEKHRLQKGEDYM